MLYLKSVGKSKGYTRHLQVSICSSKLYILVTMFIRSVDICKVYIKLLQGPGNLSKGYIQLLLRSVGQSNVYVRHVQVSIDPSKISIILYLGSVCLFIWYI